LASSPENQYWLHPSDDGEGGARPARPGLAQPAEGEDLPYKVELWNPERTAVEQVLAITAHGSIGFAAYYAATREFPDRCITLRHNNNVVSRWNGTRN
jgi:hypothetical protein